MSDTWVKQPKFYTGQSFFGTVWCGAKLIDSKTGKFTYHIGRVDEFGLPISKSMQQLPSGSYQAIVQFMDILDLCPSLPKKGKFALNKNGTLPQALVDILGTDKINKETKGKVRTLAEVREMMNSWSNKKGKAKSTYRKK